MVFGYYAAAIGKAFFPNDSPFLSLMLSLMTFGAGFLMRPLGAIVLGAYADRHGRRAGLLLTLGLMSIGILSIACMPGYAAIGLIAPLLVLTGRLLQGFSAGMELGGVSVYLSEIATPGHKGFYVSWQSASQQVAVMFAALVGVVLSSTLSPEQMAAYGWRGAAAARLRDSSFSLPAPDSPCRRPKACVCRPQAVRPTREWKSSIVSRDQLEDRAHRRPDGDDDYGIVSAMITAYTPTFGNSVLHLAAMDSLIVTL